MLTPSNPLTPGEARVRGAIDHPEDVVAFDMVALGYDRQCSPERSLGFCVRFTNIANAKRAVKLIDSYNAFAWKRVCEMLNEIDALGHSFDGRDTEPLITIGRESSPVIYVSQIDDKIPDAVAKVIQAGVAAGAAEADTCDGGTGASYGKTVRLWWD